MIATATVGMTITVVVVVMVVIIVVMIAVGYIIVIAVCSRFCCSLLFCRCYSMCPSMVVQRCPLPKCLTAYLTAKGFLTGMCSEVVF